jgi:hypothetical protein
LKRSGSKKTRQFRECGTNLVGKCLECPQSSISSMPFQPRRGACFPRRGQARSRSFPAAPKGVSTLASMIAIPLINEFVRKPTKFARNLIFAKIAQSSAFEFACIFQTKSANIRLVIISLMFFPASRLQVPRSLLVEDLRLYVLSFALLRDSVCASKSLLPVSDSAFRRLPRRQ